MPNTVLSTSQAWLSLILIIWGGRGIQRERQIKTRATNGPRCFAVTSFSSNFLCSLQLASVIHRARRDPAAADWEASADVSLVWLAAAVTRAQQEAMVWGNVAVTVHSKTQMGKTHVFSTLEFQRRENQCGEFKRGGIGNLSIFVQTINVGKTLKIFLLYFILSCSGHWLCAELS